MTIPFNALIATLILFFVTCAMGQVALFDLSRKTTKNVVLHRVIAYLGLGAAGYGLFLGRIHFSDAGWVGLVLAIIGIMFVGGFFKKRRDKKSKKSKKKAE